MNIPVVRIRWLVASALVATAVAPATGLAQRGGAVRGKVTEEETGAPIPSAQVTIDGTRLGALTGNDGTYRIAGVPAGSHMVRVARIGYAPQTRTVQVAEGGELVADFTLAKRAAQLDEVITTATGEQSRRSFGNVVATVKADSITKVAPITSVNEMLQARTSGLQVMQASGQTGAASYIRIRGISSLSLTNEPLVIIDGIRYNTDTVPGNFTTQRLTRLGDLNPEEIESIDVIKGPSAAALYGTAAANGVLVIKTKRGTTGRPQWTLSLEGGLVQQPSDFEPNWFSWGHNLDNSGNPIGNPIRCKIATASAGRCQIDSLTSYNPYTAPETRPFGTTPRYLGGVQVSGGTSELRYFLSATKTDEIGPYVMPAYERHRLTEERGTAPPDVQVHPNQLHQSSLRGNFSLDLGQNATLDVATSYIDHTQYNPFDGGFFAGLTFQMMTGPGYKNATNGTQREFVGDIFSVEQQTSDTRFTGSASLNWTPRQWLALRAVVGVDQANGYNFRMNKYGEGPRVVTAWGPPPLVGGKDFNRSNALRYSVDLGATITTSLTPTIASKTSVGGQWFKDGLYQGQGEGYNFGLPGVTTPNSASQRLAWEFTTENAQYGAFVEEQLSLRERLFVAGGVRTDQNSAFGRSVDNTVYPRASVSYVISEEPWFPQVAKMNRVRLRGAWGKAGVQPSTIAALQYLGATTYPINGVETPALRLAAIGNPNLKPEVTTEVELGADVGFLNDRVSLEMTFFNKESKDALYNRPLPPSYGVSIGSAAPTQWQNLAKVRNRGFEAAIDAQLLATDPVQWNLRLNGSHVANKLVDAGNVALPTTPGARNVVGYPLFGLWDKPILSYSDANHDGIITEDEVVVGTTDAYRGSTLPTWEAGIANTLGFLRNRVRVTALFDYRGGFYNQWGYENQRCVSTGNCREVNDPSAPLDRQAAAVMASSATRRTLWGFFVPNDFIRFRELSVSYNLPDVVAQHLRARSATLVLSGRNLGVLWTKYPGLDPEANSAINTSGGGNNDFFSPPVLRYWIARVNVAF
jgi:TonB-linked SusC/RagA family outer membrane protein